MRDVQIARKNDPIAFRTERRDPFLVKDMCPAIFITMADDFMLAFE